MRVLLKEGAERATAETILVVEPDLRETMLETLAGEAVRPGGIVAEIENWTAADAISAGVETRVSKTSAIEKKMIEEVTWMAALLAPYEVGAKVVQHLTNRGCVIEIPNGQRIGGLTLTRHERRRAEEADERGDFDSLDSRIGRVGYARDGAAQKLEQLQLRPDVRPKDLLTPRTLLDSYDLELRNLRSWALAV